MLEASQLPIEFCWTRFGAEAGEAVDAIFRRKERERRATGGVFYWGIGNSVGPGIAELVARCEQPEVLFSPIKSRPRAADTAPPAVVEWRVGETLSGVPFELPTTVRVTSRLGSAPHYALVCAADEPLEPGDLGVLAFRNLRNLVSDNPLGASQVTAIVRRLIDVPEGPSYRVALRARLVPPYFVRLRQCRATVPASDLAA